MVFEAGFISLMRTLIFIAVFFFAARLFVRYIVPFLLGRFIKKQQEKFYNQTNPSADEEGKVRVKSQPEHEAKSDHLGEYVDYEEIDESK